MQFYLTPLSPSLFQLPDHWALISLIRASSSRFWWAQSSCRQTVFVIRITTSDSSQYLWTVSDPNDFKEWEEAGTAKACIQKLCLWDLAFYSTSRRPRLLNKIWIARKKSCSYSKNRLFYLFIFFGNPTKQVKFKIILTFLFEEN